MELTKLFPPTLFSLLSEEDYKMESIHKSKAIIYNIHLCNGINYFEVEEGKAKVYYFEFKKSDNPCEFKDADNFETINYTYHHICDYRIYGMKIFEKWIKKEVTNGIIEINGDPNNKSYSLVEVCTKLRFYETQLRGSIPFSDLNHHFNESIMTSTTKHLDQCCKEFFSTLLLKRPTLKYLKKIENHVDTYLDKYEGDEFKLIKTFFGYSIVKNFKRFNKSFYHF